MVDHAVRQAVTDDLAEVAEVIRRAYSKYLSRMEKPPAPMLRDYGETVRAGTLWVCGSPVIGVLSLENDGETLFVENLAVDPASQGTGVGRRLMEFAESHAYSAGLRSLSLYTNEAMSENLELYQHLGYAEVARREEDGYRRVFMEKRLVVRPPEVVDEEFVEGLIGGRELRDIEIADHDPAWAERFVVERERIATALGATVRMIEHVGSTAVPGLAAKPVVDIQVTVDDPDDETEYLAALEQAGYVLRVREPGHRMFRTPERDVHVHIWQANSEDERRHLVFRDHLRANKQAREEYERLKRDLAPKFQDTNDYAQAKTQFIEELVFRARGAQSETDE